MNFYETQMGRHFFNSQLPRLIEALEKITSYLDHQAPAMNLSMMDDTDILHDLYYGFYEPDLFKDNTGTESLDLQVRQRENALLPLLHPNAEEQFEAYQTAVSARNSAVAEQAYKSGFRLAVSLFWAGGIQSGQSQKKEGLDKNESC